MHVQSEENAEGKDRRVMVAGDPSASQVPVLPHPSLPAFSKGGDGFKQPPQHFIPFDMKVSWMCGCSPQPTSLPAVWALALVKPLHLLLTEPCLNDAAPVEISHPFSWCYFAICINVLCSWNQIGIDVFFRTASINMMSFLVNYSVW